MDKTKWEHRIFESCIKKPRKTKQLTAADYKAEGKLPIVSQEACLVSGYTDDMSYEILFEKPIVVFGDHTRVLKYVDFPFAVGADGVKILVPHDDIMAKFLMFYLQWCDIPSLGYSRHYKLLKEIALPIPPISDQQAIVAELDKLNEVISLKRKQLTDLDSLAQSLFYEMFGDPVVNEKGWEVKKLGELALIKTGPFGSMLHKDDYISNGIPLVNPIHMKEFQVVADMEFTISEKKAKELDNYILQKNDVIFARRGNIGRCAIVSDKENGYLCGTGSLFVRFETAIESLYIMYIIRSNSFTKELISKAKGATMLNLNSNTIASLTIPLPPLSLQQSFADKIAKIEDEKQRVKFSLKDLETLLASRMQYCSIKEN